MDVYIYSRAAETVDRIVVFYAPDAVHFSTLSTQRPKTKDNEPSKRSSSRYVIENRIVTTVFYLFIYLGKLHLPIWWFWRPPVREPSTRFFGESVTPFGGKQNVFLRSNTSADGSTVKSCAHD